MLTGSALIKMKEQLPERVYDVGIAEQHAVTFAAGLAASGKLPFCTIYSTFLQRAYDQVIHDVVLQILPVVFCIDRAGVVGADGPTHHGVAILSLGVVGQYATAVCELLKQDGIVAAHYDLRFFKPLDEQLLHEVFRQYDKVITVEDGCIAGGVGTAIIAFVHKNIIRRPLNVWGCRIPLPHREHRRNCTHYSVMTHRA